MANDLNFDELDKAVHGFMKQADDKKPAEDTASSAVLPVDDTPPSTFDAPPAVRPTEPGPKPQLFAETTDSNQSDMPPPSLTEAVPGQSATASTNAHAASTTPQVHVPTRQSLAGRRAARGTFHDIIPTRVSTSPSKPVVKIKPLSDVNAVEPPAAAKEAESALPITTPSESPVLLSGKEISDAESVTKEDVATLTTPPAASPDEPSESVMFSGPAAALPGVAVPTDTPKILSENQDSDEPSTAQPSTTVADSPSPLAAPASGGMSDALREDLQKQAQEAAELPEPEMPLSSLDDVPSSDTSNGSPASGLATHEVDFADKAEPAPSNPPASGLLETGELHAALPAAAGTGPATPADTPTAPLFDTKEYHTPIAPGSGRAPKTGKTTHEKVWEWIIIVLLIVVALAAGIVAYLMLFRG